MYWSELFAAGRDTHELRAESIQMGYSLSKLVLELNLGDESLRNMLDDHGKILENHVEVSLPTAFAFAAVALEISHEAALLGSLYSMIENQVLVCVKSVPIGQVAGQRLLLSLHSEIEAAANHSKQLTDDDLTNWAPGLSVLSMQHEVQYGRVYRS